jgi:hypothetical protein
MTTEKQFLADDGMRWICRFDRSGLLVIPSIFQLQIGNDKTGRTIRQ